MGSENKPENSDLNAALRGVGISSAEVPTGAADSAPLRKSFWKRALAYLAIFGPGQMVMMADTDVGSVITAAQSGARWGYALLPLQFILIPVLFVVQELTVRLGIFTGKGHGELIRERFGAFWGWVSIGGLTVAIAGAMISEFSGVAGVGELMGVRRPVSLTLAATFLLVVVWAGSYRRVERIAMALGAFEMAFLWVAIKSHPIASLAASVPDSPWRNADFRYLAAANIGAVIMPWMVFFQQSAVVDKGLRAEHLRAARWDTAVGSLVTQIVMVAVLVTTAATLGENHQGQSLTSVGEIAQALIPYLGQRTGRLVFSLGVLGAAFVAIIVTSLAAAWGIGEMTGYKHSLESHIREAPWFYGVYTLTVIGAAMLVALAPNLIALNVAIEVMNALLLPLVLGFLVLLAAQALPREHRLRGARLWFVAATCAITSGVGIWCALSGIL